MIRTAGLPTIAMVGAAAITFGAGTALAHTVTLKNCMTQTEGFFAYDENDAVLIMQSSGRGLAPGETGTLTCKGSDYCIVRAVHDTGTHHRVRESATFYSQQDMNDFIDADCSQRP